METELLADDRLAEIEIRFNAALKLVSEVSPALAADIRQGSWQYPLATVEAVARLPVGNRLLAAEQMVADAMAAAGMVR